MKKLNYLLLGAAGLLMASCAQDDLKAPGSNVEGNYKVKVKLPAMATRAVDMNTGYTANDLYYAVYDAADDSYISQGQTVFTEAEGGALETEVGFNLAHGKSYKIAFFAAAPENNVYTFDGETGKMTVTYKNMTSAGTEEDDLYDCFINLLETNEIGSDEMQASIVLYRPIAQLNWGTSDLDEPAIEKAYGVDGKYILSNLSTKAYNTWDLLSNDVDTEVAMVDVELVPFTQPQDASGLPTFPVGGYDYVAMQYVLAPQDGGVYDLNLNITNGGEGNPDPSSLSADVIVNSAPVQANYQTNIYGALLTDNVVVNVEKSPSWYKPSFNVENTADFLTAVANGGTVTLFGDVYLTEEVSIPNNVVINLNGYDINLTTELAEGANQIAVFYVNKGGTLEINGEGNINAPQGQYGVYVNNVNSVATINGGNFKVGYPVYVQIGKAYVKGGTFEGTTLYDGHSWALNCQDANYKNGNANIYVSGGSFLNFNPSAAPSENPPANFVTEGYKVIETTDGDDIWYTVVSDGTAVTNDLSEAAEAAKAGEDIFMTGNITGNATVGNGYGNNPGGMTIKGGTLNGNGNVLTVNNTTGTNSDWTSIVNTTGGTIENITIKSDQKTTAKAILGWNMTSDLTISNVTIPANANTYYAINIDGANNHNVYITNSNIFGYCSWGSSVKTMYVTGTSFGVGTYYGGSNVYDCMIKPYNTTVFENCEFNENLYFDLSAFGSTGTITFKNCTVNGVVLTKENHTMIKGYLKEGLTDWEDYDKAADRIFFN